MFSKEVSFSVDLEELEAQLQERREEELKDQEGINVRSTVFSLGKDPRVSAQQQVNAPEISTLEILKDGLDNQFIQVNWRVARYDVDSGGVVGFRIFRRKLMMDEVFSEKRRDRRVPRNLSRFAFDRLSRKIPKRGKFSADKKAISGVRRSLIPRDILNSNLASSVDTARARFESSLDESEGFLDRPGKFEKIFGRKQFQEIGYVDYSGFLSKERKKFVQVTEREFVELSFRDKSINLGDAYEYYVCSVVKDNRESYRSNTITVLVEDNTPIDPPKMTVRQVHGTEIRLRICTEPTSDISKIMLFRKAEDEIAYSRIADVNNVNDCINIADSAIRYGLEYEYRVFAQNIHGTLSEAEEVETTSTVQRITPQSRSNTLKIPILSAVQDQNSDFIKITISPNDSDVSIYTLERKDLTINEKKFTVPSRLTTNYGGDGWITNQFFVERPRDIIGNEIEKDSDLLNRDSIAEEIVFLDNTVSKDHLYQYRVRGSDLFGNVSSHAFSATKAVGKKPLRSPINLRTSVIRNNPLRVKVEWDDDNLSEKFTNKELFSGSSEIDAKENKILYEVQRREFGETRYKSFPITANTFVVDEVPTNDAIPFSSEKVAEIPATQPDREEAEEEVSFIRPFSIPEFLKLNKIYFYRIAAKSSNGDESNFTEEFSVAALPELSQPEELKVEVTDTRIRPLLARLSWSFAKNKFKPDFVVIQRKIDVDTDSFEEIGKAYIENFFFDHDLEAGNTYVYRAKSVDTLDRESKFVEVRLTV